MGNRKNRWTFTERKYKQWSKEGRGTGDGAAYKPWLTIFDVPSKGRLWAITGIKTGREHHFLSDLEQKMFIVHELLMKSATDIKEQYPLSQTKTLQIAEDLGVDHPKDPISQFPIVMTTDLVICMGDILLPRAVKYKCELLPNIDAKGRDKNERTRIKLLIEQKYWKSQGNDNWKLLTEDSYSSTVIDNVYDYRGDYNLGKFPLPADVSVNEVKCRIFASVGNQSIEPRFSVAAIDSALGLRNGIALAILRHMIATRELPVDFNLPIRFDRPLNIIYRKE